MFAEPMEKTCRESKKNIKQRLKQAKHDLNFMADVLDRIDINYEARLQAIGSMYMNVKRLKRQIEMYDRS